MKATLEDLDVEKMARFVRRARSARQFPLPESALPEEMLEHLNLLSDGRPANAAVLLFGRSPQRFMISSEIKCAHFHGTRIAKPIPSYQVYKGTVFELVDQAVDFVLGKIALSVGTRAESVRAPVTYEIPKEVVIEAVVNAVAHRDYTSNGSVQVMLFADRLEVWNPGRLSPSLTLERLRGPHGSVPVNPLLAESLYLAEYIERMGTGTLDMIRRCAGAGLPEPEFAVTDGFVVTVRRTAIGALPESELVSKRDSAGVQAGVQVAREAGGVDSAGVQHDAGVQVGVQVAREAGGVDSAGVQVALSAREAAILKACMRGDASSGELAASAGYSGRTRSFLKHLGRLLQNELIAMTIPDKPRSSSQKYRLTEQGRAALSKRNGVIRR